MEILDKLHNEKGVTLVMVMMALVVLSVLGLGILKVASSHANLNSVDHDEQAAYYIAEAGVARLESEIETKALQSYQISTSASAFFGKLEPVILGYSAIEEFKENSGDKPRAEVELKRGSFSEDEDSRTYIITSEGIIGKRSRTVEREVTVNWISKSIDVDLPTDMAAYTNTTIMLQHGSRVEGNIGTNSREPKSIKIDNGADVIDGIIFVPEGTEETAVEGKVDNVIKTRSPIVLALPSFPTIPDFAEAVQGNTGIIKLKEDAVFDNLTVAGTLTIDTGKEDKAITLETLDLSNGKLSIVGEGNLTIYVRNKMALEGRSTINKGGDIEKLILYIKGSELIELSQGQNITGSVYAENANFEITGKEAFQGNLFTGGGKVSVKGSLADVLIYTPYADIEVSNGARVNGAIIANALSVESGARILYNRVEMEKVPFVSTSERSSKSEMIEKKPIAEIDG